MRDFAGWLHDLATEPVPGGVSAAAVAAAMGAALVVKAMRISLGQEGLSEKERTALQAVRELAKDQQKALLKLARTDKDAYRAVLASQTPGKSNPARGDAWAEATRVPISIARTCHRLLRQLPEILEIVKPAVRPDLEVGRWLLDVGQDAGISAAEDNLEIWTKMVDKKDTTTR